jgi:hypothetical protein
MKRIIFLSLILYIFTESDFEKCVRLSKLHPELNLQCDKLNQNNNNLYKGVIENFQKIYSENYQKYINNPDYTAFINEMGNETPKGGYKFLQKDEKQNLDFLKLVNPDERKIATKSFLEKIKDQNIYNKVHEQMDFITKNHIKEANDEFTKYEINEDKLAQQSPKAIEEGTKFHNAMLKFANEHKNDYKINGIIAPDGHIENNNIGNYIVAESKVMKDKFKNNKNLSQNDINSLMHLNNLLK